MTISKARGAKARADRYFSKIVRARGACESCSEQRYEQLQCAHIISRRYSATRCEPLNAFCLCASCHRKFTDHPMAFGEFIISRRSKADRDYINDLAQAGAKVDWDEVAKELEAQWKAIEAAA